MIPDDTTRRGLQGNQTSLLDDPHNPGTLEVEPTMVGSMEIGRYRVLNVVGSGGMAVVYRAYDRDLDRHVAIKLLTNSGSLFGDYADLRREARALAKLAHPNVVAIYDVGDFRGSVFIAMEMVEGQTMTDWLSITQRSWREVLFAYLQAGLGLSAAHRADIVHGDFKPSNVLIGADGRARVADFGLARELARPRTGDQMTMVAGTPAYMAPELHDGGAPTPASDQFAFGVAVWEAVFGQRPYDGDTGVEVADAIESGRLVAPPERSRVPRWLTDTLTRALEVDPAKRHNSLRELLASVVFTERIMRMNG